MAPHLEETYVDHLQPSCGAYSETVMQTQGAPTPHIIWEGLWVILWEPWKPVIIDELEVCL